MYAYMYTTYAAQLILKGVVMVIIEIHTSEICSYTVIILLMRYSLFAYVYS